MQRTIQLICFTSFVLFVAVQTFSEEAPKPIKIEAMFEVMANQASNEMCRSEEFRACFDVPFVECSQKIKGILSSCRESMKDELPRLITAENADPIIEKVYACVVPKWREVVESRRKDTDECKRLDAKAENTETS